MKALNSMLLNFKSKMDRHNSKKKPFHDDSRSETVKVNNMFWFNEYTNNLGVKVNHSGIEIYTDQNIVMEGE